MATKRFLQIFLMQRPKVFFKSMERCYFPGVLSIRSSNWVVGKTQLVNWVRVFHMKTHQETFTIRRGSGNLSKVIFCRTRETPVFNKQWSTKLTVNGDL